MQQLFPQLLRALNAAIPPSGAGSSLSPPKSDMSGALSSENTDVLGVALALSVLLHQATIAYADCLDIDVSFRGTLYEAVCRFMDGAAGSMTGELYALVVCVQDRLDQNAIAAGVVENCATAAAHLENCLQTQTFYNINSVVGMLNCMRVLYVNENA
jgi:hypothetical protein